MRPITVVHVTHYADADAIERGTTEQVFERTGPIEARSQLTSWMRECALAFAEKLEQSSD